MRRKNLLECALAVLYHSGISAAVLLSVLTMLLTDGEVDSASVFTMISLMACIKYSVNVSLGVILSLLRGVYVGFQRMETFLVASASAKNRPGRNLPSTQLAPTCCPHRGPLKVYSRGLRYTPEVLRLESFRRERPTLVSWRNCGTNSVAAHTHSRHLSLEHVTCSWDDNTGRQTLEDISLRVPLPPFRHSFPPYVLTSLAYSSIHRLSEFILSCYCLLFQVSDAQLVLVTGAVGSGKSSLLMTILGELPVDCGRISRADRVAYVSQTPWVFSGTVRENILFGRPFDESKYNAALQACDLASDLARFAKHDSTRIGERGVSLSGGQRARVSLARAVYADAELYLLDDPLSAVDNGVGQHVFNTCICGALSGRLRVLTTHQLQYLHRADHIIVMRDGSIGDAGSYRGLRAKGVLGAFQLVGPRVDGAATIVTADTTGLESQDLQIELEDRLVDSVTWRVYWEYFTSATRPVMVAAMFLFCASAQGTEGSKNLNT